jgi:hypothetical protein
MGISCYRSQVDRKPGDPPRNHAKNQLIANTNLIHRAYVTDLDFLYNHDIAATTFTPTDLQHDQR